jgi:hypothetical protein
VLVVLLVGAVTGLIGESVIAVTAVQVESSTTGRDRRALGSISLKRWCCHDELIE